MKLCDACSTILNLNGINNSSIRIITVYFYCGCLSRNEWSQAALLWLAQILLVVMPTKHNHVNRFYDYKLEQVSHLQPHPLVLAFDCTPSLFLVTHLLLTVQSSCTALPKCHLSVKLNVCTVTFSFLWIFFGEGTNFSSRWIFFVFLCLRHRSRLMFIQPFLCVCVSTYDFPISLLWIAAELQSERLYSLLLKSFLICRYFRFHWQVSRFGRTAGYGER